MKRRKGIRPAELLKKYWFLFGILVCILLAELAPSIGATGGELPSCQKLVMFTQPKLKLKMLSGLVLSSIIFVHISVLVLFQAHLFLKLL